MTATKCYNWEAIALFVSDTTAMELLQTFADKIGGNFSHVTGFYTVQTTEHHIQVTMRMGDDLTKYMIVVEPDQYELCIKRDRITTRSRSYHLDCHMFKW